MQTMSFLPVNEYPGQVSQRSENVLPRGLFDLLSENYGFEHALNIVSKLHSASSSFPKIDSPLCFASSPPTLSRSSSRSRRRHIRAHMSCHVCGDRAPNHIHYGGIACFSCRAFFRRSVPKFNSYVCNSGQRCIINSETRKNCQYCRYQKCVQAGMKASWVLSEEEKVERMSKQKENKEKKNGNKDLDQTLSLAMSPLGISSTSRPDQQCDISPSSHPLSGQDIKMLEQMAFQEERSRLLFPISENTANEIIELTHTGQEMRHDTIVELFKLVYCRVANFVGTVETFQSLTDGDKKLLLSRNLDMLSNIRLAKLFHEDGSGRLERQLQCLGKTHLEPGPNPVEMDQVFVEPWAKGPEHVELYMITMGKLSKYCQDQRTGILLQMLALFHSDDLRTEQPADIATIQENFAFMLQRHLRMNFNLTEATIRFGHLVNLLHDLRRLADILTDNN